MNTYMKYYYIIFEFPDDTGGIPGPSHQMLSSTTFIKSHTSDYIY